MKRIAILLHLYQPLVQEEKTLREIAETSYIPLIRFTKNNTDFKITINTPLSLLQQLDDLGYEGWFNDIRDLLNQDRLELTGTGAYHPLLTKLPEDIRQEQIILNEYGLGYYFGRRTGFEGEKAIMIRDLNGFFAPELSVDRDLNLLLGDFGYEWMLVDNLSFQKSNKEISSNSKSEVYDFEGSSCKIVTRDTSLSNKLAFHRGLDIKFLLNDFRSYEDDAVVALDGETFGHHNEDGIYLLRKLVETLRENNPSSDDVFLTVSEFVDKKIDESEVESITKFSDTTWAFNEDGKFYYLWEGNELQDELWKIQKQVIQKISTIEDNDKYSGLENVPVWKDKFLSDKKYKNMADRVRLNQLLSSDPLWWLSGEHIGDIVLFNVEIVDKFLEQYKKTAEFIGDDKFSKYIDGRSKIIKEGMKNNENSSSSTFLPTS